MIKRFVQIRPHSTHIPGRVGGGIKLRNDLAMREPTDKELQSGDQRKGVVMSKRIPDEFIETTLLPHLEERMRMSIHVYTPAQLSQVARSYAKYTLHRDDRGAGPLVEKLAETIKYRMPGFEAIDIIDVLPAALQLRPEDDELFGMLADRLKEKLSDFNALNLIGVVRTYLKRGDVEIVKTVLLPRLIESLATYDGIEVAEMLVAIGQSTGTDLSLSGDVHILQCLIPELEKSFASLPFVVQLNCVWALAKMNVNHAMMRGVVVDRFKTKVADLPTNILAKSVWLFGRLGAWDETLTASVLPVVQSSRGLFTASEFGRLVMGLGTVPEAKTDLVTIANRLVQESLLVEEPTKKDRQAWIMVVGGLERLGLPIKEEMWAFMNREQANFTQNEIAQLVSVFYNSSHIVFPTEWTEAVNSIKERIAKENEL